MQARRYQYGNLRIRSRRKGPDVWEFRYMENGESVPVIIGTVDRYPTKADAERAVEALRMKINADCPQQAFHHVTVGGLIDRFIQDELPEDRRFQTQSGYRSYFKCHIRPKWGNLFLYQVNPLPVSNWLKSLPLAPKTKSHIKNAMHLLYQWARRWEMIDSNPIELVPKVSNRRLKTPRVLTPEELQALIHELRDPYRTMVLVSACLGLRASEVMGLQWGAIDWDNLTLLVRRSAVAARVDETKTEASAKRLPLDADLATALLDWRRQATYTSDSDFVFAGRSGKPRWQGMILKDHLQPAADRAGIGEIGWHTFRHSYRAWLKRFATPVEIQKELMRHSDLRTTLDYGIEPDVAPAHRKANASVVRALLGGRK